MSVDFATGQIKVERITDAHDCGQAVNLTSVEAQMQGSVSMGLGEALFEEVKFDGQGRVINPSLGEYHIPTVMDMPETKCIVVESGEPNGPFGAKEVGEGGHHAHHPGHTQRGAQRHRLGAGGDPAHTRAGVPGPEAKGVSMSPSLSQSERTSPPPDAGKPSLAKFEVHGEEMLEKGGDPERPQRAGVPAPRLDRQAGQNRPDQ